MHYLILSHLHLILFPYVTLPPYPSLASLRLPSLLTYLPFPSLTSFTGSNIPTGWNTQTVRAITAVHSAKQSSLLRSLSSRCRHLPSWIPSTHLSIYLDFLPFLHSIFYSCVSFGFFSSFLSSFIYFFIYLYLSSTLTLISSFSIIFSQFLWLFLCSSLFISPSHFSLSDSPSLFLSFSVVLFRSLCFSVSISLSPISLYISLSLCVYISLFISIFIFISISITIISYYLLFSSSFSPEGQDFNNGRILSSYARQAFDDYSMGKPCRLNCRLVPIYPCPCLYPCPFDLFVNCYFTRSTLFSFLLFFSHSFY